MHRQIAYATNPTGLELPIANEQISKLEQELCSSGTEVHFHLQGATAIKQQPSSVTKINSKINSTVPTAPKAENIDENFDNRPVFEIENENDNNDIVNDLQNVEPPHQPDQIEGVNDQPSPQVHIEQVIYTSMAEDRALLPEPFGGHAEQDPSEFWRRLTSYLTYKGVVIV